MDNKKLQEFLSKIEAQSALPAQLVEGNIQPLGGTVYEDPFEEEVPDKNVDAIIGHATEFVKNHCFTDKSVEIYNVDENGVSGNGEVLDFDMDIMILVDYNSLLRSCGVKRREVTSCKLVLFGKTKAGHSCSLYPLASKTKICDIGQDNNLYNIDLSAAIGDESTGYFRLGDPNLMDSLVPSMCKVVINDTVTATDFTVYKNSNGEVIAIQAIVSRAMEFKKKYVHNDKYIKLFNVDEVAVYSSSGTLDIGPNIQLAGLVNYTALLRKYDIDPDSVKTCELVLRGRKENASSVPVCRLDSTAFVCNSRTKANEYFIDLCNFREYDSADFRINFANTVDTIDLAQTQLIVNNRIKIEGVLADRQTISSIKDIDAISRKAKSYRDSFKFSKGLIKLFCTDGEWLRDENDYLMNDEVTDLIGILDYKKLMHCLGYGLNAVHTCQLLVHGRVPVAGAQKLYSFDNREYIGDVVKNPGSYYMTVDLKSIYEQYGSADFILAQNSNGESFDLSRVKLNVNGNTYSLLNLYNSNGFKEKEIYKSFSLAGGVGVSVNMYDGSAVTSFKSVNADDFIIPVNISHIHAEGKGGGAYGRGWRLNLDRRLDVSENDTADTTVYTFTDETGNSHTFTEIYYYIENGERRFVDKSLVNIDLNGKLTYNGAEVKKQQTCGGYTLIPESNDFADSEFLDQRLREQAELEDYVESYERSLSEYVRANSLNGEILYRMSSLDKSSYKQLINGVTQASAECLMTESEALQLQSLYSSKQQLTEQISQLSFQRKQTDLQEKQLKLQKQQINQQVNELLHSKNLSELLSKDIYPSADFMDYSADRFFKDISLSGFEDEKLPEIREKMSYKSAVKNLEFLFPEQAPVDNQIKITAEQLSLVSQQKSILNTQSEMLDKQLRFIDKQINYLITQSRKNLSSVKDAFKKYFGKKAQLDYTLLHSPVNYLKDGNGLISGFNESGALVCIFDAYGNSVAVEYNNSSRIMGLHDSNGKAISFKYSGGKLACITDTRGRTVKYGYTGDKLTNVTFADGSAINFTYDGTKLDSVTSDKGVHGLMRFANDKVTNVSVWSKQLTIEKDMQSGEAGMYSKLISSATFVYGQNSVKINYLDDAAEEYEFAGYNKLSRHSETDELGFKTYTDYSTNASDGTIIAVSRNNATADVTVKTYCGTTEKQLSEQSTVEASDSCTVTTLKTYFYDEDERLVSETVEKTTAINGVEEKHTAVVNYHYNAGGLLILTESKIIGEENTSGVNYTERTYDKNGNVTKTVSWNSLDASSKFYTQNDVAENGQIIAERNSLGEISAEYEYAEGTNAVNTVTQANGSKLSYGRNPFDFSVNSVTQSTADGEANTTDVLYACGLPVEVKSGNTVINYAYDCYGRKTSVAINGALQSTCNYFDNDFNPSSKVKVKEVIEYINDKEDVAYYSEKMICEDSYGENYIYEHIDTDNGVSVQKYYNNRNKPTKIVERFRNSQSIFEYDAFNRITLFKTTGQTYLMESFIYNARGEMLNRLVDSDYGIFIYAYTYRNNATRSLDNISINDVYSIKPLTDVNGRSSGKEILKDGSRLCAEYISYRKVGDHATNMPATIWFANGTDIKENLRYKYDRCGNIAQITQNGDNAVSYEYDGLNRLERENNQLLNKTVIFTYDANGNIANRCEYPYTVKNGEELSELTCKHFDYIYDGDRLIKILSADGEEQFAYNNLGSPTTYRNKQLQWQYGRLLTKYGDTTFEYDGLGRRIKKSDIKYVYDSEGKLVGGSDGIYYIYDDKGIAGFAIPGYGFHFYRKDAQGNIIAILDTNGNVVVRYEYDAWGNHKVLDGNGNEITDPEHIGHLNPIRYRGYFYDEETGLYYLQTRYYDPTIGRFISQDGIEYADPQTPNGINLYAYCANNPVMAVDPMGNSWKSFWSKVGRFFAGVASIVIGAAITITNLGLSLISPLHTVFSEIGLSLTFYGAGLIGSVFNSQIYSDMSAIGWNPFNSNVDAVMGSNILSFYKGVPIFRTPKNSRSGTFGIMLLARNEEDGAVQHEFGHVPQLLLLGTVKFLLYVGIPSAAEFGPWAHTGSYEDYYNAPWETMADMFGGVTGWYGYQHTQKEYAYGIMHLITAKLGGPFSFLFAFAR